jgi:hypothetical protein
MMGVDKSVVGTHSRKSFAVVAAVLMVLVVFQVVARPGSAMASPAV